MKGLELSINMVITVVIVVVVLTVISFFFFNQTGSAMTTADATRIFNQACANVHCTTEKGFCQSMFEIINAQTDFWKSVGGACQTLYNYDQDSVVQCMQRCNSCQNTNLDIAAIQKSIKTAMQNTARGTSTGPCDSL